MGKLFNVVVYAVVSVFVVGLTVVYTAKDYLKRNK